MAKSKAPTLVSLFAGCGGSSCGYHMAGIDVRAAVEWDEEAAGIYADNFPKTAMLVRDVCEVAAAELLEAARLEPGQLDILDGSPPCQGFSTAGKRKMGDRRNRLFEEYVRLLREIKPRAFIMENVTGLRKGKMRLVFAEMTSALRASGYKVACRELNAWWYGVPQDRRRLIWIGLRDDVPGEPSHPQPTHKKPITVAEALGSIITKMQASFGKRREWDERHERSSATASSEYEKAKDMKLAPRFVLRDSSSASGNQLWSATAGQATAGQASADTRDRKRSLERRRSDDTSDHGRGGQDPARVPGRVQDRRLLAYRQQRRAADGRGCREACNRAAQGSRRSGEEALRLRPLATAQKRLSRASGAFGRVFVLASGAGRIPLMKWSDYDHA